MAELFDIPKTKHAGASPWQRYKAAKEGMWPVRIGWLTCEVDDELMAKLVNFASRDRDWRKKVSEALDGLCRN